MQPEPSVQCVDANKTFASAVQGADSATLYELCGIIVVKKVLLEGPVSARLGLEQGGPFLLPCLCCDDPNSTA